MAADIQFAPDRNLPSGVRRISAHLQDDGYYWWLYWYFEAASLPPREAELIDLYGDSEISGYQLERLRRELEEARFDATQRPDEWRVVIGWNGAEVAAATERVSVVRKTDMLRVIDDLLLLATTGLKHDVPIVCIAD
jgi:hypothetical protein